MSDINFDAHSLLLSEYHGVLSTHSVDAPGYPFGSVVPYCMDSDGQPVILISTIAQHTKNIQENPKVSLIVTEGEANDVQAAPRLTWLGNANIVSDDENVSIRYYKYFPESRDYHKTHDFNFYRIELVRARYIGGFGIIRWLEPKELVRANPFSVQDEHAIVSHMNHDHADAMIDYCCYQRIELPDGFQPIMVGVDAAGFHLRVDAHIIRFAFPRPVNSLEEVRQILVEMTKQARHK
jgi:hypothetical protein